MIAWYVGLFLFLLGVGVGIVLVSLCVSSNKRDAF